MCVRVCVQQRERLQLPGAWWSVQSVRLFRVALVGPGGIVSSIIMYAISAWSFAEEEAGRGGLAPSSTLARRGQRLALESRGGSRSWWSASGWQLSDTTDQRTRAAAGSPPAPRLAPGPALVRDQPQVTVQRAGTAAECCCSCSATTVCTHLPHRSRHEEWAKQAGRGRDGSKAAVCHRPARKKKQLTLGHPKL